MKILDICDNTMQPVSAITKGYIDMRLQMESFFPLCWSTASIFLICIYKVLLDPLVGQV